MFLIFVTYFAWTFLFFVLGFFIDGYRWTRKGVDPNPFDSIHCFHRGFALNVVGVILGILDLLAGVPGAKSRIFGGILGSIILSLILTALWDNPLG